MGDSSLNTLLHLKFHSTWRAGRGGHGGGQNKSGRNGEDITIPVPLGTVVWRTTDGKEKEFVVDIIDEEPVNVCRGGAGGYGNARFTSSVQQEPRLAQKGEGGEAAVLGLELKLLADVGIVGKPNAGKSTLLASCSGAHPKIAPYPFTTKDPVLGVTTIADRSFVIMEVPGLIEGAHKGTGLGHEFLRHAERARLLIHIIDGQSADPVDDLRLINQELASFNTTLAAKVQIVVLNKIDIPEVREQISSIERKLESEGSPLVSISAATGEGVQNLIAKTLAAIDKLPKEEVKLYPTPKPLMNKIHNEPYRLTREGGVYVVYAPQVERLLPLANLDDWRVMVQVWKELERVGVVKALQEKGVEPGDTVRVGGVDLEWF